jgi:hypothetical protein
MDVDGSGAGSQPVRLTGDNDTENYPSWSPDGKRLAYQRDHNGPAIYVIIGWHWAAAAISDPGIRRRSELGSRFEPVQ